MWMISFHRKNYMYSFVLKISVSKIWGALKESSSLYLSDSVVHENLHQTYYFCD